MLDGIIDYLIGMHFPASDIPKQAQALYKINRIRLLHDRAAETARLVSKVQLAFKSLFERTFVS
jgi:light-regulated signal transduction histidine kinase (bacteriophytochrome)